MSRSWIERSRGLFAPKLSAGFAIGRDHLGFARIVRDGNERRVQMLEETRLDTPLFRGAPSEQAGSALVKTLTSFAAHLSVRYLPVHVSLPDPVVRISTFELQALPKSRAGQVGLVKFRFGREAGAGAGVYAAQPLGTESDKHLLLGMACDEAWQRLIHGAFAKAGIVAWSVSANLCRQFNRFHDRLTTASGALVAVGFDTWSLCLWDARGRVRYMRSRWRCESDDHAEVAREAERSIVAYLNSKPGHEVAHVYALAGAKVQPFAEALDARLHKPCVRLSDADGLTLGASAKGGAGPGCAALAAALER